jgi:hypothetical protein
MLIMAMALHYRPSIVLLSVTFGFTFEPKPLILSHVRDVFARYSISSTLASQSSSESAKQQNKLKSLSLPGLEMRADAFEFLIQRLGESTPNLIYATLPPAQTSSLCLYSTRHLRSLAVLHELSRGHLQLSSVITGLQSPNLSKWIKFVPQPVVFDKYYDVNRTQWKFSNEWRRVGEHFSDIMFQAFRIDSYPSFVETINSDGRFMKQMWYEELYVALTKQHKFMTGCLIKIMEFLRLSR